MHLFMGHPGDVKPATADAHCYDLRQTAMNEIRALLLTDVVDSTSLAERLGDEAVAGVWAAHDRAARALLPRWRGREIDKTDGMLLLFGDAEDALHYALDYHRALRGLPVPLRARAGLHLGPVMLRENSADDVARGAKPLEVEGLAKAVAARLMALALGGQTLLSASVRQALGRSPQGVVSHGHWQLKGLSEPIELFEAGDDASPWQPPADGAKAYRVVADGELWKPVKQVRHNLPRERDAFVGRTADLAALARLVDEGAALVTLLGTGGSGKTRLARRFAWTWLGEFPGGAWFCDLSYARSLDGIVSAMASALDVPLDKGDTVAALGHAIAGRNRCLVILDNFEQVAALAADTVGAWVDRARDAVFVVTSRERLHLPGEQIFAVEPLPDAPAVALFEARAKAQDRHFALGDADRADVAAIVQALDGIPLAIELAAARVRVLPPRLLRERLHERFSILGGASGRAERQATLLAAIAWSWELLAPWEKSALAQCSAFEGGFTLGAAEAVLDLSACPGAPPALDVVQALVDKCLLRAEAGRHDIGEPFFAMYVSIHEYAAGMLRAPGRFAGSGPEGEHAAWARHWCHCATLGTPQALHALHGPGGAARWHRLALELDNLVAACRRANAAGDAGAAVCTFRAALAVFEFRGPFAAGVALGRETLACAGLMPAQRARVLAGLGFALRLAFRLEEAREVLQAAHALELKLGDYQAAGSSLAALGSGLAHQGHMDQARQHFEGALAMHREHRYVHGEASVLCSLGALHFFQGRMDDARHCFEQALTIHRSVGHARDESNGLCWLGIVAMEQGRMKAAEDYYARSLVLLAEVDDRRQEGVVRGNLAILHFEQGRMDTAQQEFERALAIDREVGNRYSEAIVLGDFGALHQAVGRPDAARDHCERAIAIQRETGDRRHLGGNLRMLGSLFAATGDAAKARAALTEGEDHLRQVGDKVELGKILCVRGELEAAEGDRAAASRLFDEAARLALEIDAGPPSSLGKFVSALRQTLGAAGC